MRFSEYIINNVIINEIKDLLKKCGTSVINTEGFYCCHNELCENINKKANEYNYLVCDSSDNNEGFHYGQAQKWVNMTLKYMFITEKWAECFENIKYFLHAPIDNYILEGIWNEKWIDVLEIVNIKEFDLEKKFNSDKFKPWSQWDKDRYKDFIDCLRDKVKNQSLIEWETKTWLDVARDKSGSE